MSTDFLIINNCCYAVVSSVVEWSSVALLSFFQNEELGVDSSNPSIAGYQETSFEPPLCTHHGIQFCMLTVKSSLYVALVPSVTVE